jgi:hypothetical protein
MVKPKVHLSLRKLTLPKAISKWLNKLSIDRLLGLIKIIHTVWALLLVDGRTNRTVRWFPKYVLLKNKMVYW